MMTGRALPGVSICVHTRMFYSRSAWLSCAPTTLTLVMSLNTRDLAWCTLCFLLWWVCLDVQDSDVVNLGRRRRWWRRRGVLCVSNGRVYARFQLQVFAQLKSSKEISKETQHSETQHAAVFSRL